MTYGVLPVGADEAKKLMLIVPAYGYGGGGTDIRYNPEATQNDAALFKLEDRIMVAGGGGHNNNLGELSSGNYTFNTLKEAHVRDADYKLKDCRMGKTASFCPSN